MYLDNPRTNEEIKYVKEYIVQAYKFDSAFWVSEDDLLPYIQEFLDATLKSDGYIKGLKEKYSKLTSYDILARMWVIARYDDEGQIKALKRDSRERKKQRTEGSVTFLLDEHPIIKNSYQLTGMCHLISLLTNPEELKSGHSFILDYDHDWFSKDRIVRPSVRVAMQTMLFLMSWKRLDPTTDLGYLPSLLGKIEKISKLIDGALDSTIRDNLLYVCSMLRTAGHDVDDEKTKIVVLVSIIEMLLTHNPDFNRFNVEDSINKQFQLKASILVYLQDKTKDIVTIRNRLREIYGLRSSIAHGDIKGVTKFINAEKKKGEDYPLDLVAEEIYTYLQAIITAYLDDVKFVEFLKVS